MCLGCVAAYLLCRMLTYIGLDQENRFEPRSTVAGILVMEMQGLRQGIAGKLMAVLTCQKSGFAFINPKRRRSLSHAAFREGKGGCLPSGSQWFAF